MNVLTVTVLLLISGWVYPNTLYCPSSNDLVVAYSSCGNCDVSLSNQGWTLKGSNGGAGVATKAAFNLEGGYVSYTINLANVQYYVNANIYGIFPSIGSSGFNNGNYCDAQKTGSSWCPELDFIESNGHCAAGTTVHTISGTGGSCDNNGCATSYTLSSSTLNMKVSFDGSGIPSITSSGASIGGFNPSVSGTGSVLSNYSSSRGTVLYSSIWQGWSPSAGGCTSGSQAWGQLSGSSFTISNLQIYGTVKAGPTPATCSGAPPPPPPPPPPSSTTTKAPTPSPSPTSSTCSLSVSLAGKQCHGLSLKSLSSGSQANCQAACCAQSGCKVYQWWGSQNQCWIDTGSVALTTSNCPSNSGSFVSFAKSALTSAETVDDAVKTNYPYIIVGAVILVVLVGAIYFTLRSKARRRGQTTSEYVRESVAVSPKTDGHVPLEATPSAAILVQDTPVAEPQPVTTPNDWVTRVDETSGQTIYYNNSTGATQWEMPDGFVAPSISVS